MNDDDNDDDDNDGDDSDGDDDDDTSGYAPPPGSLRPNELSDVEEKAHYLPIATFLKSNSGKKYSTHEYKSNLFLTFSSRLL